MKIFLAIQAVPIKASHFYNKITLKRLGQKLSFDVFAMLISILTHLYYSHGKFNQLVKTEVASDKRHEIT